MPQKPAASPSTSTAALRLALEGFSAFERQALQSYFRLCADQQPAFESGASLADCELCVVDADRPAAVEAVRAARRQAVTVYVGARAPEGAAAHLRRPIDARRVVRALEAMAPAGRARVPAPLGVAAGYDSASTPRAKPAGAAATPSFDLDVLVVDQVDIARRFLALQLSRLGCRVTEAVSAEQALARLAEQRFRLVFSDMALAGLDGLGLCQRIKGGAGAPSVVLVGAPASASDHVRGLLSGCDAYLGKPIVLEALIALLRAHGDRRRRAR